MAISCSPADLVAAAKCFSCIPKKARRPVKIYLLCGIANVGSFGLNLIPNNATYGGTAEFDLTVLANTPYVIVWGSNELSMTLCGVNYPSPGAGGMTVVFTAACTVMQFFGTFAGTTVTAKVHVTRALIPIPTGFTFAINAGGATETATWNNPNLAYVTYSELWTSTDGVTYSLASTVNFPTATTTIAAPANGNIYAKVRWCGPSGCGAFTPAIQTTANANLLTSLISYWKLDENIASGDRADSAGTNTLTDVNANVPSDAGGIIGRCVLYDAATVGKRLNHVDNAQLGAGAGVSFTIVGWIKATAIKSNAAMLAKWGATTDYLLFQVAGTTNVQFTARNVANSATGVADSGFTVTAGVYEFWAMGYDDSLQQIWIQRNAAARISAALVGVLRTAADFTIGNYSNNANQPCNARIDEVGFWKRSLAASEVTQLYKSGVGMTYPFS